ncbi:MAG: glycosyltransferase family 2 protein [Chitinophagales bacterium]
MPVLSIVIPCYNSAENIADLQIALEALAKQINNYSLEIILVDDGSKDDTYNKLIQFSETTDLKIIIVKLTGNFGSYNTFLAGLSYGTGDVYAHMHPDMQDPPEHLVEMLNYYEKGIKFVIGQRVEREDKNFNQLFAHFYHWLIKKIGLTHIPEGGYDLILFDKALRNHVVNMNEKNANLVYLISWLQYPFVTVPITRISRKKGKSQWTFSKKSKLLFDSIVAFSYTPIRWMTYTSMFVFIASIVFFIYLLFSNKLSIYLSLILFFGNLILIFMSIVGEYLWRTLDAARNRPNFVVDKVQSNKS